MLALSDCPIRRLWCQFIFPAINTSVDMRVKFPNFIGSIVVPDQLQHGLHCIYLGHLANVKELAAGRPARLHSITVYGVLRQPMFSSLVSIDLDLGPHGAKDVEYLSFSGYGEVSCYKTYSYDVRTCVSQHASELHHLCRRDTKSWYFSLQPLPHYPRQFLHDVHPDSIATDAYGEQRHG